MFRILIASAIALAALLPFPAAAQATLKTTYALIRCESERGGRESYCPADTRRGVQLVRDLNGRCQLGRTWGYDYRGIWVRGCDGEFEIGRRGDGYGWGADYRGTDYVVCESRDFKYARCPVDDTRGGVRLLNVISKTDCIEGENWGYDRRQVWVDDGCAAEFAIGAGGDPRPPGQRPPPRPRPEPLPQPYEPDGNLGSIVLCESKDNRRRSCSVDLSGRYGGDAVNVTRNISQVPCREGVNWGYDNRGVWVDGGCRAEFRVVRRGGGIGRPPPPVAATDFIHCESRDFKRTFCDVGGRYTNAQLRRQSSKARCIEGQTWGYERGRIWVDQGCAGEFEFYR